MGEDSEQIKLRIIRIFEKNVKGKSPDLSGYNSMHDGAEGDWLTKQMGLTPNGRNEPDFEGFEMKKDSTKITFGDWSPDHSLFKAPARGSKPELTRKEFLQIFGTAKTHSDPRRNGRFSWSGKVFPVVNKINEFGQTMLVNDCEDIQAVYNFSSDLRPDKKAIIPAKYQIDNLELAKWCRASMKLRVENKFNQLGWFRCVKNEDGIYDRIVFGKKIDFPIFISLVRSGKAFCDSGMHDGNNRPYLTWRANKNVWDELLVE